jgi:hypothetical protein
MPRRLRLEYPGAIYHVLNRGDRREPIFRDDLDALGWDGVALAQRPKGDMPKVRLARRLRAETSVTLKWIAEHLNMGTWMPGANRLSLRAAQPDNQPDLNLYQK